MAERAKKKNARFAGVFSYAWMRRSHPGSWMDTRPGRRHDPPARCLASRVSYRKMLIGKFVQQRAILAKAARMGEGPLTDL